MIINENVIVVTKAQPATYVPELRVSEGLCENVSYVFIAAGNMLDTHVAFFNAVTNPII